MKDDKAVQAALQILKENAETDFEKLSVARLETVLNAPPKVIVIDDKHQEFDGKIYFRNSDGYYFSSSHLHVAVWETYRGKAPKGFQIHHGKRGVDCNEITNLSLKTHSDHAKLHFDEEREKLKENVRVCRLCGKDFIPVQYNQIFCSKACQILYHNKHRKKRFVERVCLICGKTFKTADKCNFTAKTCSMECAGKLARQKAPVTKRKRNGKGQFVKE